MDKLQTAVASFLSHGHFLGEKGHTLSDSLDQSQQSLKATQITDLPQKYMFILMPTELSCFSLHQR